MRVLITGASGFIGTALSEALLQRGDEVIAWVHNRSPQNSSVKTVRLLSDIDQPIDAVVNLAGAPIADARWSDSRKALLLSSRKQTTEALVQWLGQQSEPPQTLISGSAIGFYGACSSDELVTEASEPHCDDFSAELCQIWESAARAAEAFGTRVCLIRTGIVLGKGGALAKMRLPFLLGGGGPIASGKQWMPWIHLDDEVQAILHLLDNAELSGAFNLTAPKPARNREFVKAYAASLNRPALFPMPAFAVRLMLGSEASTLLTEGLKVVPERLIQSGFKHRYTDLHDALRAVEQVN